jgi:hypothetical protein
MEQMKPEGLETIQLNFDDPNLPMVVRKLQPLVWHDEASICVLLGPDPQAGVFGCGPTVEEALKDWTDHVDEALASSPEGDEVVTYIRDVMNASVKKIN